MAIWSWSRRRSGGAEPVWTCPLRRKTRVPNTAPTCWRQGQFLWNAGIFLFSVEAILDAFDAHAPGLIGAGRRGRRPRASADLGFLRLAPEPWAQADDISIDYAVMERADNLSRGAVQRRLVRPRRLGRGLARDGPGCGRRRHLGQCHRASTAATRCCGPRAESLELVGIGLEDIVAIAMPDAVLVRERHRAQEVKQAVAALKAKGAKQAEHFPRITAPGAGSRRWCWPTASRSSASWCIPAASLSLQSHHHRAEHWVVVSGTARVTIGDEVTLVSENQSVYVPLGARHRMENPGKVDMVLIEVQTGIYLGEDDIIRYEDVYARG